MRGIVFLIVAPATLSAQQVIRLDKPEQTHPAEWTNVVGVRELRDGRVLVLDAREQVLKLVDFRAGTASVIGAKGNGPGEYVMPTALYAMPGDSAMLFDEANSARPMIVGPNGVPVRSVIADRPDGPPFPGAFGAVDTKGRMYRASSRSDAAGISAIERLTGGKVDTAGFFSRKAGVCATGKPQSPPKKPQVARAAPVGARPFVAIEEWAVAPDGRVAVVCPHPYRVRMYGADRRRIDGPIIQYAPIKVTSTEKDAWRDERKEPLPVLRYSANGVKTAGFEVIKVPEPADWPDVLPPFTIARALHRVAQFAPNGSLWIARAVGANAPPAYDVVGADGRLLARATLPARSRIVGFGPAAIYVVQLDDDDVQHLQRFRFPPMRIP